MHTKKQLTTREQEILLLIRLGKTNKEVAADLGVSVNTIKTHMKNLFAKLEVSNRTQATLRTPSAPGFASISVIFTFEKVPRENYGQNKLELPQLYRLL